MHRFQNGSRLSYQLYYRGNRLVPPTCTEKFRLPCVLSSHLFWAPLCTFPYELGGPAGVATNRKVTTDRGGFTFLFVWRPETMGRQTTHTPGVLLPKSYRTVCMTYNTKYDVVTRYKKSSVGKVPVESSRKMCCLVLRRTKSYNTIAPKCLRCYDGNILFSYTLVSYIGRIRNHTPVITVFGLRSMKEVRNSITEAWFLAGGVRGWGI